MMIDDRANVLNLVRVTVLVIVQVSNSVSNKANENFASFYGVLIKPSYSILCDHQPTEKVA